MAGQSPDAVQRTGEHLKEELASCLAQVRELQQASRNATPVKAAAMNDKLKTLTDRIRTIEQERGKWSSDVQSKFATPTKSPRSPTTSPTSALRSPNSNRASPVRSLSFQLEEADITTAASPTSPAKSPAGLGESVRAVEQDIRHLQKRVDGMYEKGSVMRDELGHCLDNIQRIKNKSAACKSPRRAQDLRDELSALNLKLDAMEKKRGSWKRHPSEQTFSVNESQHPSPPKAYDPLAAGALPLGRRGSAIGTRAEAIAESEVKDLLLNHSRAHVKKLFRTQDTTGNGTVGYEDVRRVLGNLGLSIPDQKLRALFNRYDSQGAGYVDYYQLLSTVMPPKPDSSHKLEEEIREKIQSRSSGPHQMRQAFKHFDQDGSGEIDYDEFTGVMAAMGVALPEKDAQELFKSFDSDGGGTIDYNEFVSNVLPSDFASPLGNESTCTPPFDTLNNGTYLNFSRKRDAQQAAAFFEHQEKAKFKSVKELENSLREKIASRVPGGGSEVLRSFRYFDKDGSGTIDKKEFQAAISSFGMELDDADIDSLWKRWDAGGDGEIAYDKFVKTVIPPEGASPLGLTQYGAPYAINNNIESPFQRKTPESPRQKSMLQEMKVEEIEEQMRYKMQSRLTSGPYEVRRAFKYFDRNGNGQIEMNEFKQCLEGFGFQLSDGQIHQLFDRYDKDRNGRIDYEEFSKYVLMTDYTNPNLGSSTVKDLPYATNPPGDPEKVPPLHRSRRPLETIIDFEERPHPSSLGDDKTVDEVERQIRDKIAAKTVGGSSELRRAFRYFDADYSGKVDFHEFSMAMHSLGVDLTKQQRRLLWNRYDADSSGDISWDEFVHILMPADNKSPLGDPSNFTPYALVGNPEGEKPRPKRCAAPPDQMKIVAPETNTETLERNLREKVAGKLHSGPFEIRRSFKYFDKDGSGKIDRQEFAGVLKGFGYDIPEEQMTRFFDRYDPDRSGTIDYNEFVDILLPSDYRSVLGDSTVGDAPFARNANYEEPVVPTPSRRPPEKIRQVAVRREPMDTESIKEAVRDKIYNRDEAAAFELKRSFRYFDKEQAGGVTEQEFNKVLANMGMDLSQDDTDSLFQQYRRPDNRMLDYKAFLEDVLPDKSFNNSPLGRAGLGSPGCGRYDAGIEDFAYERQIVREGMNAFDESNGTPVIALELHKEPKRRTGGQSKANVSAFRARDDVGVKRFIDYERFLIAYENMKNRPRQPRSPTAKLTHKIVKPMQSPPPPDQVRASPE